MAGRARGALAARPPDARRRGRGLVAGILVAGLAWACAYGVAHPVAGASSSGGSGAPLVRGVDPPVRSGFVALEARGSGTVTLLGLRPAGAAAGLTRVVAAGSSPDGVVDGPAGLRPRLPAPVEGGEAWFTVRPCPAATVVVDRLEARVRSWSGTRWVAVRVAPAIRLRCAP